jgi:hypothetical protein
MRRSEWEDAAALVDARSAGKSAGCARKFGIASNFRLLLAAALKSILPPHRREKRCASRGPEHSRPRETKREYFPTCLL